jgi:hypothetical protein
MFIQRKAELRAFQGSRSEYHQAAAAYEDRKSRTVHFANCARTRRSELHDRVRRINQRDDLDRLAAALRTLTQAVADHRNAISPHLRRATPRPL